MEHTRLVAATLPLLALVLAGCKSSPEAACTIDGATDAGVDACLCAADPACPQPEPEPEPEPDPVLQIETPEIEIEPGQEITYCYYFRLPNTAAFAIKGFRSRMSPGVASMTVHLTANEVSLSGTVEAANCTFDQATADGASTWLYAAHTPEAELAFPADDGTGKPVGMAVQTLHPGYLRMHMMNPGLEPIRTRVELDIVGHPAGTELTPASTFTAQAVSLSIAPSSIGVFTNDCDVPSDRNFFWMSTFGHMQATLMTIEDGAEVVFETDDWSNPGSVSWAEAPFRSFSSGKLTYECRYYNNTIRTIEDGDSFMSDEACKALTYVFPATQPARCYDSIASW